MKLKREKIKSKQRAKVRLRVILKGISMKGVTKERSSENKN